MAAKGSDHDSVSDAELYDSPSKRKAAGSPKVPYYLRNFLNILNHVLQNAHNASLFSEGNLSLLRSFHGLQAVSQQLYVRLFLRNHRWFKASKLSYPQITNDLQPVLEDLLRAQFLIDETQLEDLPAVLDHLQLPELKQLCKELKLTAPSRQSTTKASLTQLLLKHARQHKPLFGTAPSSSTALLKKAKSVLGRCVKVSPSPRSMFQKCVLLFSLESTLVNEEDEQSEGQQLVYRMLETDDGRTVFPDYDIIVTKPFFSTAQEFTQYCAAYDSKQNLLVAVEGGRMEEVISITQECIGALSACIGDEEEEFRCKREKLDALLGKMCGRAHSTESAVLTRAASAPPRIQDEVIILSDSDDNNNDKQGYQAKTDQKVDLIKCRSSSSEDRSTEVTDEAPKSSLSSPISAKQVTLFDCRSAMPQAQVAGRHPKEKRHHGHGEQDKGYKGAKTASVARGRNARLSLSLRRKQRQEDGPTQQLPTCASTNAKPISSQGAECDGEVSLKRSRSARRLQPMRAVKKLTVVFDQTVEEDDEEESGDDEDFSLSVCSSQPSPTKPKRAKSSPATNARNTSTRARKISTSLLNEDDEDCEIFEAATKCGSPLCSQPSRAMKSVDDVDDEDFESSPKYSSPLRKLPRRALLNEDDTDDNDFELSPEYSSPLRKQQIRAAKRLKFGADSGNGAAETGESLCSPLPADVTEFDRDTPDGGRGRSGATINLERAGSFQKDAMETTAVDSSARRGDGRSGERKRTDSPSQPSSALAISIQSSIEMEDPLPTSKRPSSREQQAAIDPVQRTTRQSQDYSSGHQSRNDVEVDSSSESFQQLVAGEVHVRVLSHAVEYLEKQRRYHEACALLQLLLAQSKHGCSNRGQWFDRLALNLDFHLKQQKEAFSAILRGLSDASLHPGRKHSLHHRAVRICHSQKWTAKLEQLPNMEVHPFPEKEVLASTHPHKRQDSYALFVHPSSPSHDEYRMVSVEQLALEHYKVEEGWSKGVHAEGRTFSTMFGLLFWDVIFFHSVPDVFRSRYQGLPLDFYGPEFYRNRRSAIDDRLKWIENSTREELSSMVAERWKCFEGQQCSVVTWTLVSSADEVKSLASCIGGEVLAKVCSLFATQPYAHYRGGLPDLTLWNPQTGKVKFVEVKGPSDRLSSKQVLWLSRLVQWGCEAEVCRVKVKR